MSTFTIIVLILFVGMLAYQFVRAIEKECHGLACMFGLEILMFAYLAKVLM